MKPTVILTANNMGPYATEVGHDAWAAFVAKHIDETVALSEAIEVDQFPFGGGPDENVIIGLGIEGKALVREALESLWGRWCREGS